MSTFSGNFTLNLEFRILIFFQASNYVVGCSLMMLRAAVSLGSQAAMCHLGKQLILSR